MIWYFQKWSFFLPYTAIGLTFTASFMIIFSTLFNTIYFLNKNSAFNRPKFKMISFKALYISFAFQLFTIGFVHACTILFGMLNIILFSRAIIREIADLWFKCLLKHTQLFSHSRRWIHRPYSWVRFLEWAFLTWTQPR